MPASFASILYQTSRLDLVSYATRFVSGYDFEEIGLVIFPSGDSGKK